MRVIICPTCKKETTWENNEFRPFCSERCKLIDFGAWADEEYRVPVVKPGDFLTDEKDSDDWQNDERDSL